MLDFGLKVVVEFEYFVPWPIVRMHVAIDPDRLMKSMRNCLDLFPLQERDFVILSMMNYNHLRLFDVRYHRL